ncbi:hypothetical protein OIV83_006382 [Microbotryomycetes sp. JL201]|nr:hypothetical protein OIV83_006382 [Microbotryomycetes sp. JL201]
MSDGRTQKQDLLVRVRYQNKLPPPPFAPRFVHLATTPQRYATYEFLNALNSEREVPMVIDQELGMHLELGKLAPGDTTHGGYWTGADRSSVAPAPGSAPALDEDDLALLADVGASAGSQTAQQSGASTSTSRGKADVSWLRRTEYLSSEGGTKPTSLSGDLKPKVPTATLSRDERFTLIEESFKAVEQPLSQLRHPSKPHLKAEASYELLPDDLLWANNLNLVRFGEDPGENKTGSSMRAGSDRRLPHAVFRPLQFSENDARIAYFLLEDDEQAERYRQRRETGDTFNFKWARDYELATARQLHNEFVFSVEEGEEEEVQQLEGARKRKRGVYYAPIGEAQQLRKRRPRRGEDPKSFPDDIVDQGIHFWDGIDLQLRDIDARLPEHDKVERANVLRVLEWPPFVPEPTPEPEEPVQGQDQSKGEGDEQSSGGRTGEGEVDDDDAEGEEQMAISSDAGSDV